MGRKGTKEITVVFRNVQSIVNKMDEVKAMMSIDQPDVMAFTETWTHGGIGNEFLEIDGYELLVRSDRNDTEKGRGGGILVYIRKNLNARHVEEKTEFNQSSSIEIKDGRESVKLHVIYRSPNSSKTNDEDLCKWIGEMRGGNVLIGDFNFPDIDWANGRSGNKGREFFEATTEQFMDQLVTEPTHKSGNLLDLVLCNREEMVKDVRNECRMGKSDHDLIAFEMTVKTEETSAQNLALDYDKARFNEMRAEMAKIDWKRRFTGKTVNEMWVMLRECVQKLMSEFIPFKKRRNNKVPPWMDIEIKRCIREKKKAWKKWKESKKERDRDEYKRRVNEVKKKIRKKKNAYERKVAECRKSNPKMFYAFINKAKKTRCRIGPLVDREKNVITEPGPQANVLNQQYASVFTVCNDELPTIEMEQNVEIEDVKIEKETVMRVIDNLKEHSAGGPDGITPRVIKELKSEIAEPLTILFKKSMETGQIPDY